MRAFVEAAEAEGIRVAARGKIAAEASHDGFYQPAVLFRDVPPDSCLARKLQAGQVVINNYGAGGGVELPIGGVKPSGHGREKGFEALFGFTRLKTVAIRHG